MFDALNHCAPAALVPNVTKYKYKIVIAFDPREGYTRHSSVVAFNEYDTKGETMG